MGRWVLIALLVIAAWWGWTQHDRWRARGTDEFVFVNRTGAVLERLQVRVHDMRWSVPRLAADTTVTLRVRCEDDGPFELSWQIAANEGRHRWSGGEYNHGPLRMRHRFELLSEDGVIWTSARLAAVPAQRPRPTVTRPAPHTRP